jgi:hypothetical protein
MNHPLPNVPTSLPRASRALPRYSLMLLTLAACFAWAPVNAAVPTVTGTYESEGSIVETDSDYSGPVSLRALFGLNLDLAAGSIEHAAITRVEIEQRDRTFTVRTKDARGALEWSGTWERNGGYEPTADGVKILLRHARFGDDFFMFILSPLKDGEVLLVDVQRIQAGKFGPTGKPVGKFLFLRAAAGG